MPPSRHFGKAITVDKVDIVMRQGMETVLVLAIDRTLNMNRTVTGLMVTNRMATNQTATSRMGMGIKAMVLAIKVMGNMLKEEIGITAPAVNPASMNWTGLQGDGFNLTVTQCNHNLEI